MPSLIWLVSDLFSYFLEFKAPCLPQIHICSWVCTPVIINKCSGIAQRSRIVSQIVVRFTGKPLLYSCFPQTRKGSSVSCRAVVAGKVSWREREPSSVYVSLRDTFQDSLKNWLLSCTGDTLEQLFSVCRSGLCLACLKRLTVFLQYILCYILCG